MTLIGTFTPASLRRCSVRRACSSDIADQSSRLGPRLGHNLEQSIPKALYLRRLRAAARL